MRNINIKKLKNKNFIESFRNAIDGLVYVFKQERNIKVHFAAAIFVFILGIALKISKLEFLVLWLTVGFVIVCELVNTAIEEMVNLVVKDYHPQAKIIKDVAAGAVLLASLVSVVVGYFIFFDKIILLAGSVMGIMGINK